MLAALTSSTESLVLIGDHQQLRPKPAEFSLSVETSKEHNLDVSLFEPHRQPQQYRSVYHITQSI